MSSANLKQHGGEHYKSRDYQHWDWVCDTGMHYLLGCATKYVSRWRKKNGVEDLKKAIHYLEKATEEKVVPPRGLLDRLGRVYPSRFINQHELTKDRKALELIVLASDGDYAEAIGHIEFMIESGVSSQSEPDSEG